MPRVRRRPKARTAISESQRQILLNGKDYFGEFDDMIHIRAGWNALRDELLPSFVEQFPGSRPYAWWLFDAPGRRERIDGGVHPHDRRPAIDRQKRTYFGRPAQIGEQDLKAVYETQETFLRRHSLLSDAEEQELENREFRQ